MLPGPVVLTKTLFVIRLIVARRSSLRRCYCTRNPLHVYLSSTVLGGGDAVTGGPHSRCPATFLFVYCRHVFHNLPWDHAALRPVCAPPVTVPHQSVHYTTLLA